MFLAWSSLACRHVTRASPGGITWWSPSLFPPCAPASSWSTLCAFPLLFLWRHRHIRSGPQPPPVWPHLYFHLDSILQSSYFQRRSHSQVVVVRTLIYLFEDTFNPREIGRDNNSRQKPQDQRQFWGWESMEAGTPPCGRWLFSRVPTFLSLQTSITGGYICNTRQDPNITYYYYGESRNIF